MDAFDYQLYNMVLSQHPNASKEAILAEYAKHLEIKRCIESQEFNNILNVIDVTSKTGTELPSSEAATEETNDKKKKEKVYIKIKDLKEMKGKKVSKPDAEAAIKDESITCLICNTEHKSLGKHLYDTHKVSSKDYIEFFGYEKGTHLMSKNAYEKSKNNLQNARANNSRIKK